MSSQYADHKCTYSTAGRKKERRTAHLPTQLISSSWRTCWSCFIWLPCWSSPARRPQSSFRVRPSAAQIDSPAAADRVWCRPTPLACRDQTRRLGSWIFTIRIVSLAVHKQEKEMTGFNFEEVCICSNAVHATGLFPARRSGTDILSDGDRIPR